MNQKVKLALIAPTLENKNSYKNKDRKVLPLGIYALESYLSQYYKDILIIDAITNDYTNEQICQEIIKNECNIIGISGMTNKHYKSVISLSEIIRNNCNVDYLFVGGALATFCCDVLLECPAIDFVVRGEGEYILKNILDSIKNKTNIFNINGLVYKSNGKIKYNNFESRIKDLSSLPLPKYNFNKRLMSEFISGSRAYVIMASRGCMGQCYFCQVPYYYGEKGIFWRTPQSVVEEIEYAIKTWGVRRVNFQDSNFLSNENWLKDFIGLVKLKKLDFTFNAFADAESVNEKIICDLKQIGLYQLFVGFETGSEKRHNLLGKKSIFKQNNESINILKRQSIKIIPGFILYYPDSTIEEIEESVKWFENNKLIKPSMYFNKMDLWYGTNEYNKMKIKGKVLTKSIEDGMQYEFEDPKVYLIYKSMHDGLEILKPIWEKITNQNYEFRTALDDFVYNKINDNLENCQEVVSKIDEFRRKIKQFDNGRNKKNECILSNIISLYFHKVVLIIKESENNKSYNYSGYMQKLIDENLHLFEWFNINEFIEALNE